MTPLENEFHSNRAWLGVLIHRPRNIKKVYKIPLDRLTELEYITVLNEIAMPTKKGIDYYYSLKTLMRSHGI